jgi:phosphate transport system substrate-binding protein
VPIDGGKGPITPTHDTIEDGTYSPFGRPLFIYVNAKAVRRPDVKAFVNFYLDHASEFAEKTGYVKLPDEIIGRARENFKSRKTGSQFTDDKGGKVSGPLAVVYQ